MSNNNNTPPPWSEAPPWANWRAQDSDGVWVWFQYKPIIARSKQDWTIGEERGDFEESHHSDPNPNWRDTLEKRPE